MSAAVPAWVDLLSDEHAAARLSAELEAATPEAIVDEAVSRYGHDLVLTSAFGVEGVALIDMVARRLPGVRVLFIDTGYHFEETLSLMTRIEARYDIDLRVLRAQQTIAEQDAAHGDRLHHRDPDLCCRLRKVDPLEAALAELAPAAWLAALRRDQSATRRRIPIIQPVHRGGRPLMKFHPLANWGRKDSWRYVFAREVPYNALLDEGYTSIGCAPCTRAARPGAEERSGRWSGSDKTECGLHVDPAAETFTPFEREEPHDG